MKPRVSVVVPTFRRPDGLTRALHSIKNQLLQPDEVIVVDDNRPGDSYQRDSLAAARAVGIHELQYMFTGGARGGGAARNVGIERSSGELIAFLDDDDEWLPAKLDRQLALFASVSPAVGAVYCGHWLVDTEIGTSVAVEPTLCGNIREALLQGKSPATTSAFVLRRDVLESVGAFDESLSSLQDYDLWIRVSKNWEFDFVADPLIRFIQHSGSRTSIDIERRKKGLFKVLRKMEEQGLCQNRIRRLRRHFMASAYWKAAVDAIMKNRRLLALRMTFRSVGIQPTDVRKYKYLLLSLTGRVVLKRCREVYENARSRWNRKL